MGSCVYVEVDGLVVGSPALASALACPKISRTAEMNSVTAAATANSLERCATEMFISHRYHYQPHHYA